MRTVRTTRRPQTWSTGTRRFFVLWWNGRTLGYQLGIGIGRRVLSLVLFADLVERERYLNDR